MSKNTDDSANILPRPARSPSEGPSSGCKLVGGHRMFWSPAGICRSSCRSCRKLSTSLFFSRVDSSTAFVCIVLLLGTRVILLLASSRRCSSDSLVPSCYSQTGQASIRQPFELLTPAESLYPSLSLPLSPSLSLSLFSLYLSLSLSLFPLPELVN